MNGLTWEPDALLELDRALANSPRPAFFQSIVNQVVAAIVANPKFMPLVGRSKSIRLYSLPKRLPYSIIYLDDPPVLHVLAFPHHKQRPGYWRNRLRPP